MWDTVRIGVPSIIGYVGTVDAPDNPYPIIALNQTDNAVNPGDAVLLPPHSMHLHPAPNGDEAILRFTAPTAGTYAIQGFWERYDASTFGDGTLDNIYKNGISLVTTYLPPDSYGREFPFDRTVSLSAGDTLDFVVDLNGDYTYDTTGLGLTISDLTDSAWTDSTGNYKAKDPDNWSSGTAPQPGEDLFVPGGSTLDVRDNDLQGNPLNLGGSVTLNMSSGAHVAVNDINNGGGQFVGGAPITANIRGHGTLGVDVGVPQVEFQAGAPVTVNLDDHATLDGTFDMQRANLAISGGDHAKFINDGETDLRGVHAVIGVDVVGTGVFDDGQGFYGPSPNSAIGGFLEFGGGVSGGQTINVLGSGGASITSRLVVDQPHEFHASVDLFFNSIVDLVGLTEADHWSYANDVLSIRNVCGKVVDRLHVVNDLTGIHGLSVSKTSAGDVLVTPGGDFNGSLAVPTT